MNKYAVSRTRGVLAALAGLVLLSIVATFITLMVAADNYASLSFDRERAQTLNALDLKLQRVRGDLTSVTFWDEAVQNTAVSFNPAWVDENIGQWLHNFYRADRVFVVGPDRLPRYASAKGISVPITTYGAVATNVAPLITRVQAQSAKFVPGAEDVTNEHRDLSHGFDAGAFSMIDGQASLVVVTPILPDFGHVRVAANRYHLLVSVYHLDKVFLQSLSNSVQIGPLTVGSPAASTHDHEAVLALRDAWGHPVAKLHWHTQRHLNELIRRLTPYMAMLLISLAIIGIMAFRYIVRTARDLFRSRHEATHDALTGLANRRLLTTELESMLGTIEDKQSIAVMFIDLDRFKQVNDAWGHEAGDTVLKTTARRIALACPAAHVARFGGDEFVLVLPDTDMTVAKAAAALLLASLRLPHKIEGSEVVLAGSIGIAMAPDFGRTVGDLLRRADLALIEAKSRGRDRAVAFDPEMDQDLHRRRVLETELRAAVETGAIKIVYQPQICARTGRVRGAEALARWLPVDGPEVPARIFVQIAEDSGLIVALGRHVLNAACMAAASWGDVRIAVNLSPAQLRSDDIVTDIAKALAESGLPACQLTLELTERLILDDSERTRAILTQIRALGVRLALNDFGVGYSGLVYLRRFKLDSLKIDKSLLENLDADVDNLAVLASAIALGHALGLEVIGEGVETAHHAELLRHAGCDQLQGYLFARPMPRAEFDALLHDSGGRSAAIPFPQAARAP